MTTATYPSMHQDYGAPVYDYILAGATRWQVLWMGLAILSLSLGVMNLLPIPALDGGRFLFQLIELITRRKPPEKWENAIHISGFILLMGLMVVITWNDIIRIFFS